MSYYHIKNINIDKKNNNISADLADSCWHPIEYSHIEHLFDDETFEEKYANFIYNLVSGNFHPTNHNNYSKLVMNSLLSNYFDDARDIGRLNTYNKYKEVVNGILTNDYSKCIKLESDRTLNPKQYYELEYIDFDNKNSDDLEYYKNSKGSLFCLKDKKLMECTDEGNPMYYVVYDLDLYKQYNDFLKDKDSGMEY